VNNTSREENVPINEMHTEDVQGSMPSIGTALVALCRTTLGTSNRPPKHRGPTVQHSVPRTSGNRNSNDGPRDKCLNLGGQKIRCQRFTLLMRSLA
jgi:hypothetical protein